MTRQYDIEHGGFEFEGYDNHAIHPTEICWTRQSCFSIPYEVDCLWKFVKKSSHIDCERSLSFFCVDREHNIIVSCCDNNYQTGLWGALYKIAPDGTATEIFHSHNMRLQSPVIRANGDILVTSGSHLLRQPHLLFCLSADGELRWKFELGDWPIGSPTIDDNGNIFICTRNARAHPVSKVYSSTLFCIGADGTLSWKKELPYGSWYEPVISISGNIYLCLYDNHLHAFDKKGKSLWKIPMSVCDSYPPIPCKDGGLLCVLSRSSPEGSEQLLKISEKGEIIWRFDPPEQLIASMPAIDQEGNLYINMSRNMTRRLFSLDCNGNIRWEAEVSGLTASAPPVIGADGNVYQQSGSPAPRQRKAFLEAFDSCGKKMWTYAFRGEICSTVLADNGLIYILANCITNSRKDVYSLEMNINWQLHAIGDPKKHSFP